MNKNIQQAYAMPKKPLRNSAKAVIIKNNSILCTVNRDLLGDFYLLPGGGQEHGETLDKAVYRECLEEIGAAVKVGNLLFVREYISANHELAEFDDNIHQIEFMFSCELLEEVGTRQSDKNDAMQIGVLWVPVNELSQIRFYPGSLIEKINCLNDFSAVSIYLGDTL